MNQVDAYQIQNLSSLLDNNLLAFFANKPCNKYQNQKNNCQNNNKEIEGNLPINNNEIKSTIKENNTILSSSLLPTGINMVGGINKQEKV